RVLAFGVRPRAADRDGLEPAARGVLLRPRPAPAVDAPGGAVGLGGVRDVVEEPRGGEPGCPERHAPQLLELLEGEGGGGGGRIGALQIARERRRVAREGEEREGDEGRRGERFQEGNAAGRPPPS